MPTKPGARPRLLSALLLVLAGIAPACAGDLDEIRQQGQLRIALYQDFPPYSVAGQGVDADLARALAAKLGLRADIVSFPAGEDMKDDLRNMVWKGHYLGTRPADVMMHVPVDAYLARGNQQVRIVAPYYRESLAVARDSARIPPLAGSAAVALEPFTREKIGVERGSLADGFLLGALGGRLRDNVVHFRTLGQAAEALRKGEVAAVMGPRGELESALKDPAPGLPLVVDRLAMPELRNASWAVGMAVKADDARLAEALEAAAAALRHDGTMDRILARYGISSTTAAGDY